MTRKKGGGNCIATIQHKGQGGHGGGVEAQRRRVEVKDQLIADSEVGHATVASSGKGNCVKRSQKILTLSTEIASK